MAKVSTHKVLKPKPATEPLTLNGKQVAQRLGISAERAYAAIHAGQLPSILIGGRRVVPVAALERMLAEVKADQQEAAE
jgi:excisionase family DNA binding protein